MNATPADTLILLPVRDLVLFPGMVVPIVIGRPGSIAAAQEAARSEAPIGVILQRSTGVDDPRSEDLHRVGTVANILRYLTAPDGSHHVVCQGVQRFRVLDYLEGKPFLIAHTERISDPETTSTAIEARAHQLRERAEEALRLLPQVQAEVIRAVETVTAPGMLADLIAGLMDLQPAERQTILET
ncbi:MAG: LON peptidase substrate-binding domain-containing protein, partial [Rhodospirillales bacterium]|nr:LON peptidase substrate-binding domain-containing protein [Rhodospirillales bacterium]